MNIFQSVRMKRPGKNKFDLSHERKMSMKMGPLYPIMVQEIVPGDHFRVKSEVFLRMAPMLAPIMHRVNVTTHYFFVPNRLLWSEWEEFITGGTEGTSNPVWPHVTQNVDSDNFFEQGNLADYMGLPLYSGAGPIPGGLNISALPFRAYQLIYNEYYRDQNLIASVVGPNFKASGQVAAADLADLLNLRTRCWEKDYFTSALPWSQRGGDVTIPFDAEEADINYKPISNVFDQSGADPNATANLGVKIGDDQLYVDPTLNIPGRIENIESIEGAGITVNELRRSIRLQEWLEKNARGGARYTESNLVHFGVRSSDARLQRPEYLGGGRNPMVISEVLSTFQDPVSGEGEPQGNMSGHGVSMGRTNGFRKTFEEHGFVIGIISVIPRTAYQQGVNRMWSRTDKLDYYWPAFANIGEQEILNKELYQDMAVGTDLEGTFGYTPRYAEYKYCPSTVHGEMRTSLNFWHMGRIFANPPVLNGPFVTADPTDRIFPVQDLSDTLYCQLYNRVDAVRPMPYFGTPTL